MEAKPTFALLLKETVTTDSWSSSGPTLRITASVVMLVDGNVRNPLDGYKWQEDVADLMVQAHLDASSVRFELEQGTPQRAVLWGWQPQYVSAYSVDLRRATAMVKTLKRIAAHEAKLSAKYGDPTTFGERLIRIADALGISTFLLWQTPPQDGGNYDSGVYDTRDAGGAIAWVGNRERLFKESVTPAAAL